MLVAGTKVRHSRKRNALRLYQCWGPTNSRRKIYSRGKCESIKNPINVRVSPSSAVKCYPCRQVPLNYNRSLPFHGGDRGSTPVRDANFLSIFAISPDIKQMKPS
jgi:hypothetical protein